MLSMPFLQMKGLQSTMSGAPAELLP